MVLYFELEEIAESGQRMSEKIISLIKNNPKVSAVEIAKQLGKTSRTVERKIAELKKNNRIKRIGPDKGGFWQIIESEKDSP